jgi:pimeloyl-ACP methyl ester carboxylesterase
LPHNELAIIEQAGHLPTLEQPEAVTSALRRWMGRLPSALS